MRRLTSGRNSSSEPIRFEKRSMSIMKSRVETVAKRQVGMRDGSLRGAGIFFTPGMPTWRATSRSPRTVGGPENGVMHSASGLAFCSATASLNQLRLPPPNIMSLSICST